MEVDISFNERWAFHFHVSEWECNASGLWNMIRFTLHLRFHGSGWHPVCAKKSALPRDHAIHFRVCNSESTYADPVSMFVRAL